MANGNGSNNGARGQQLTIDLIQKVGVPSAILFLLIWWVIPPLINSHRDLLQDTSFTLKQNSATLKAMGETQQQMTLSQQAMTRAQENLADSVERLNAGVEAIAEVNNRSLRFMEKVEEDHQTHGEALRRLCEKMEGDGSTP